MKSRLKPNRPHMGLNTEKGKKLTVKCKKLVKKVVIVAAKDSISCFVLNIFTGEKTDGTVSTILDLPKFNENMV